MFSWCGHSESACSIGPDGDVLAEFRGNAVVNGQGVFVVVATGVDISHGFRLTAEPTTIWGGGTAVTVYNPVVLS